MAAQDRIRLTGLLTESPAQAGFSYSAPVKADAMADIAHPDSVRTSIRWRDVQPEDPTDPTETSGIPDPDPPGWYLQESTDKVAPKYQAKRTPDDPYTATYCDRSVEARFALLEDPDDPNQPGELRLQPEGLILTQGPRWATRTAYDHGGATGYPPKQSRYDDWRTFVRWALDKYADPYGIQHVSLWLEPDNKKNWGGWDDDLNTTENETVTSEEYADLLNATAGAFDGSTRAIRPISSLTPARSRQAAITQIPLAPIIGRVTSRTTTPITTGTTTTATS